MPKTKSEDAKIDFRGNPRFCGQFPSVNTKTRMVSGQNAPHILLKMIKTAKRRFNSLFIFVFSRPLSTCGASMLVIKQHLSVLKTVVFSSFHS